MSHSLTHGRYEPIQSRQNPRLKDLRNRFLKTGGAEDRLIAVEGMKLVQEAARSGLRMHSIFVREGTEVPSLKQLGADLYEDSPYPAPLRFLVARDAFDHVCATSSPQGIAALLERPQWSLEELLQADRPLLLILAGLQDPGNTGTVIRTAEAFGATGILLTPGTVHPWNQKVLRASAGSSFRVPVVQMEKTDMLESLRKKKIPLYACAAQDGCTAEDVDFRRSAALVIGNEGAGIPDDVLPWCSGTIHIRCPGPVESLNAAVAASILLYVASQQRERKLAKGGSAP